MSGLASWLIPLLLIASLAGCIRADDAEEDTGRQAPEPLPEKPAPAPPPAPEEPPKKAPGPTFNDPVLVDPNRSGSEPVIAVSPVDAAIYLQARSSHAQADGYDANTLWKSLDGGRSFDAVALPQLAGSDSHDGFVAIAQDGRLLLANSYGPTERGLLDVVFLSDDGGDAWTQSTFGQPASHRIWLWPVGETVHGAVYTYGGPSFYWRSMDGGSTWVPPVEVHQYNNYGAPIVATSRGLVTWPWYDGLFNEVPGPVPEPMPREWYTMTSSDGATWTRATIALERGERASVFAGSTVDAADTFFVAWAEWSAEGSAVYLASSTDGLAWSEPYAVAQGPGLRVMPWVAARAPGELGLVWYENPTASGDPRRADGDWYATYALVTGAGTEGATATVVRAADEALHVGGICLDPFTCEQQMLDGRLKDYPWIAFDGRGKALLALGATESFGLDGPDAAYVVVIVER